MSLCPGKPCPFIPGRYSVTNVSCGGRQYVSRASDIGSTTRIEVPLPAGRTAVAATLIHFRPGRAAGPRPRMPPLPAGSGAPRVRFRVGLAMGRAPTWRPARARRESGLDADAPDARLADDAVQQFGVWQVDGLGLAIAFRGTACLDDAVIDANIAPVPLGGETGAPRGTRRARPAPPAAAAGGPSCCRRALWGRRAELCSAARACCPPPELRPGAVPGAGRGDTAMLLSSCIDTVFHTSVVASA